MRVMEISRGNVSSVVAPYTCSLACPKFTNMTAGNHLTPSSCASTFAGMSLEEKSSSVPQGVAGTPNETALLKLMERTGYQMLQENGQRKYGGPPPGWEGPAPLRGCEIFIGKIPRDCYEDELVPVFEKIGRMYEFRLMMDFSGSNRGYAFVMYTNKADASRAVKELNNYEIRKGRFLGVCMSVDNCRLFVGGIPKTKKKDEILQEIRKVTEGVVDVIVYPSATDKTKNRGFAFVEYDSHRAAAMARRKLIPGRIQLWGHPIAVDWAEPEQEVDEDVMSTVKILYVRNLMLSTTEETIEKAFNKAAGKENAVERVKKIKDYAFVHFRDRNDAIHAMNILNDTTLDNSMVEVVLAKPVDKNDYVRYTRTGTGRGALMQVEAEWADLLGKNAEYASYGYEPAAAAYAAPTAYYSQYGAAAAAAASLVFDRGFQNRNHLGYRVSPGGLRGRGRGAAGSRGAGGRTGYIPMRSYRKHPAEDRFVDIVPGMELTPTNPVTLKPQSVKNPVQVLEDLCGKNGWGSPIYQLHSTMTRDGGAESQLFLYKVSIPALANNQFSPNKLCRSVDEAKMFASEYVLMQLGVAPETGGDPQLPVATSVVTSPTPAYQGHPLIGTYSFSNGTAATLPATTTSYVVASVPGKMVSPPPPPIIQTHVIGYDPQYQAALSTTIPYAQYP